MLPLLATEERLMHQSEGFLSKETAERFGQLKNRCDVQISIAMPTGGPVGLRVPGERWSRK